MPAKYTLFTFHVFHGELHEPLMPKEPSEFGRLLAETATHRATISEGIYVFETKKGWHDMHRLRSQLVQLGKEYVELPFEEALAGFFSPSVASKLREFGKSSGQEISLLNLSPS